MDRIHKYSLSAIFAFLFCFGCFAQSSKIDSLRALLREGKSDTNAVNNLNALSWEFISTAAFDSALFHNSSCLRLAHELNFKKGIADAYNYAGIIYYEHGNYPKALDLYFKSLKIAGEIGNKKKVARLFSNIGVVYKEQRQAERSLEYYNKALKIDEELKNKIGIARDLGNIGLFYTEQNNYAKALDHYNRVLTLAKELDSKQLLANTFGNIGIIYNGQGDSARAKGNFDLAQKVLYPKALEYYNKGYKLSEELNDKYGIASCLGRIGWIYANTKDYSNAETYLLNAIRITKEIGALYFEKEYHQKISEVYAGKGDYKKAMEHYQSYADSKDSLFTSEKNKALTRYEINYEFAKKEATLQSEQDKKDAVAAAESKKQKIILILVSCALLLVFVFAGFITRSLRITRKQKLVIEVKNEETETQKKIIEQKNKDILDSIHYAKRIQHSLLPTEKYIDRSLNTLNEKT